VARRRQLGDFLPHGANAWGRCHPSLRKGHAPIGGWGSGGGMGVVGV
jgi:hypothetical protein